MDHTLGQLREVRRHGGTGGPSAELRSASPLGAGEEGIGSRGRRKQQYPRAEEESGCPPLLFRAVAGLAANSAVRFVPPARGDRRPPRPPQPPARARTRHEYSPAARRSRAPDSRRREAAAPASRSREPGSRSLAEFASPERGSAPTPPKSLVDPVRAGHRPSLSPPSRPRVRWSRVEHAVGLIPSRRAASLPVDLERGPRSADHPQLADGEGVERGLERPRVAVAEEPRPRPLHWSSSALHSPSRFLSAPQSGKSCRVVEHAHVSSQAFTVPAAGRSAQAAESRPAGGLGGQVLGDRTVCPCGAGRRRTPSDFADSSDARSAAARSRRARPLPYGAGSPRVTSLAVLNEPLTGEPFEFLSKWTIRRARAQSVIPIRASWPRLLLKNAGP